MYRYVNINYTTLNQIIILLTLIRITFKLSIYSLESRHSSLSTKQLKIIYFFRLSKVNRRQLGHNMFFTPTKVIGANLKASNSVRLNSKEVCVSQSQFMFMIVWCGLGRVATTIKDIIIYFYKGIIQILSFVTNVFFLFLLLQFTQ